MRAEPTRGESTAAEPTGSVPWRSRTVQVVLASTLLAPLGVPLVSPALPVLRDAFGVTDAQASLLVSAYFLTGIVLSPFVGVLADRIGRKRVLVGSLLGFGLTGGAVALAPAYDVVLALRVVQGTAAAGIFVTTVTILGDAFEGAKRNAALGVNNAVLSAGAAVFPIVGGALVAVSWTAPFLAYLAAVPVALVAAVALPEPTEADAGDGPDGESAAGPGSIRGALSAVASPEGAVFYGSAFGCEVLLFGAIITSLPFLLVGEYGLAPLAVGLVLTATEATSVVVSARNGWVAERVSNVGMVAVGFGCYGAGLLVAWAAPAPWVVAAGAAVFGAGLGLTMPAVDAGLSDLVPERSRAGALSLRNSTTFLGRAAGPVLFTTVGAATGYPVLLFAGGLAALAVALAVGVWVAGGWRTDAALDRAA